jgi:hypothetical protein
MSTSSPRFFWTLDLRLILKLLSICSVDDYAALRLNLPLSGKSFIRMVMEKSVSDDNSSILNIFFRHPFYPFHTQSSIENAGVSPLHITITSIVSLSWIIRDTSCKRNREIIIPRHWQCQIRVNESSQLFAAELRSQKPSTLSPWQRRCLKWPSDYLES